MIRNLILQILACGLVALIFSPSLAQTDEEFAEAKRLNDTCIQFYNAGKYDEAIGLCQRALVIREKAFNGETPDGANTMTNLATLYSLKGEYAKAEPLYERALAIRKKVLGSEHPDVANSLNGLAELYRVKSDYEKAEPLFQDALRIYEKAYGEHPLVATVLNNLATLYYSRGEYAKAEPRYQRALVIYEKLLGSSHPSVAISLNNLAELYRAEGDYTKGEPLYLRALAIYENAHYGEHPVLASVVENLAGLYKAKGEYAKAEPLFHRALAIREKVLGSDHPDVANSLSYLAGSYGDEGDYAKAEPLYRRTLAIYEKAFGGAHPFVAISLNSLGRLYTAKKDYPHAVEFLMRGQEVRESNINAILATGSEKQKQLYLSTLWGETDGIVSLHAYSAPANVQAARLALIAILRRKGRALDAMTDQIAGLRRRAAPDDVRLLDALTNAQSQLANLQLSNDTRLAPAERRAHAAELETEIEKLQQDIGRRSPEYRARTLPVTLDAVRAAIPADGALVEIFVYKPYNAKAKSIYEYYGEARYVAYVLKPQWDAPQAVDLGEAAPIDSDLQLWREALLNPASADVRQLGQRVDERVMRPVRNLLGATKRLFISPDGALNLIPFAALVDENNRYLVETYTFNYLASGRDLVRLQVHSENRPGAYIFANPTYNLTGQPVAACQGRRSGRGLRLDTVDADAAKRKDATVSDLSYRDIDFTRICYPALAGTAEEATRINAVLTNATLLTDKRATEAALKALNAPSILHVATHGFFFLADQPPPMLGNRRQLERPDAVPTGPLQENPMLRSGLILAGVNQKQSGGREGVLTAQEAAGLNLFGTRLVVLSACETGLGDVQNGAGVYGLRRSLVLAGSETQVMSLWQVSDAATRDLMIGYYTRLQAGAGRIAAMHQVQLAMLQGTIRAKSGDGKADWHHPYYWAAFIPSGAWTTLDGKEPK